MKQRFASFDAPDLPPVIVTERTAEGWRGLTEDGEIYKVRNTNGAFHLPERLAISTHDGTPLGFREVCKELSEGRIDEYLAHFNRAVALTRENELATGLEEWEHALIAAPTSRARFGRSMVRLGLGRWPEGLAEYEQCERAAPFMRPNYAEAIEHGIEPWQGQDLAGKRIILVHDHGFGDSIMCLRFVPMLRAMGAEVVLMMPQELIRLAAQVAPVTANTFRAIAPDFDYFCPILHVMTWLKITPETMPLDPYLTVKPEWIEKWRGMGRRSIGVAWSVGMQHMGDYLRGMPLANFVAHFGDNDLVSVQQQGGDEAEALGVPNFIFEDFADLAGLMMLLDKIVTVDTAAVHLAGAIGHPNIKLLLSHWCSWRWLSPCYRNITLCRQSSPGDWASAFDQC